MYKCLISNFYFLKSLNKNSKNAINQNKNKIRTTIILLILFSQLIFAQNLTIYTIDVGQGDAQLLTTKSGVTMMIDVGGTGSKTTKTILELLNDLKINHLKYLIITHYDKDHIVGVTDLIKSGITIDTVYDRGTSVAEPTSTIYNTYAESVYDVRHTISYGYKLYLDKDVVIKCVCVNGQYSKDKSFETEDANTLSVGLLIKAGKFEYYTAGDVDFEVEDEIAEHLSPDLIKVSHHGSRTATSEYFLSKIDLQAVIISCGSNKTYKHPHQEVVERISSKPSVKYIYQTETGSGIYSEKVKVIGTIKTEVFDGYFRIDGDIINLSR